MISLGILLQQTIADISRGQETNGEHKEKHQIEFE